MKPLFVSMITVINKSYKNLLLEPIHKPFADYFVCFAKAKETELDPGNFTIVDLKSMDSKLDLNACHFIWGKRKIKPCNLEKVTKGECTVEYLLEDPHKTGCFSIHKS